MHLFAEFSSSHLFLVGLLATSTLILVQARRCWQAAPARPKCKNMESTVHGKHANRGARHSEGRKRQARLHELAEAVTTSIDRRITALEQLRRTVHQETLRLESAFAKARPVGILASPPLILDDNFASPSPAIQPEATRAACYAAYSPVPKPHFAPHLSRICELADAGRSAAQISAATGVSVAQVELTLRQRNEKQTDAA